ncbi:hypothetical protein Rhal01_01453 [Rubritalea halochordaticola]|uniref:FtsQ-type POTRA domain-containing protein n=1 Tax=Rubritalea halochordaticola TaxID=714537 RepID=A0ABP9UXU0_9BACT
MFLSRRKKLTRDREAGMVFRWRGGLAGNRGGMTLAIFLTGGIFTLAFVGLNINVRKSKPLQRRVAKIMLVPENDERLSLWVDQKSPFPARWDPADDQEHLQRVEDELTLALATSSIRETEWREMPASQQRLTSPSIFKVAEQVLPELSKGERELVPEAPIKLQLDTEMLGDLAKRRPTQIEAFEQDIPAEEFGKQFRWFISLDREGNVVYLAPVEPGNGEFSKLLENWLRGLKFKAADIEMQAGEMVVRVGRKRNGND